MKSNRSENSKSQKANNSVFFKKESDQVFFEHRNSFFPSSVIRAKLSVNQPNDKYEQEADAMADKVVQRLASPNADTNSPNNFNNLSIQRKCAACEHEEEKIQKKEGDTPAIPATAKPQIDTAASTTSSGSIVDDNVVPAPGQMRKTEFLNRLKEEVCLTVNQALAGTPFSSDNCPYIQASFARHQNSSPSQIEALINRYCPSAAQATSAEAIIQQMKLRVYSAAKEWAKNGGNLGDISQIFGGMAGGIGSAIGGIASSFSGMLFKANDGGAAASQTPQSVMQSLGRGQSLDSHSKGKMESAFGTDFSNVEIHTDSNAANLSNNMNARAFTVGNHIAFGSGEHQPGTLVGDALMAHELAHTIQQGNGKINQAQMKRGYDYDGLEAEANQSAINVMTKLMRSDKVSISKGRGRKSGLSIQRCSRSGDNITGGSVANIVWSEQVPLKGTGAGGWKTTQTWTGFFAYNPMTGTPRNGKCLMTVGVPIRNYRGEVSDDNASSALKSSLEDATWEMQAELNETDPYKMMPEEIICERIRKKVEKYMATRIPGVRVTR